jgi:SAM-dependent methyltransferase
MKIDIRTEAARYYDNNPTIVNDIPFYQKMIPHPDISMLELGCGTGRVVLPLTRHCRYIQGIDISPAMISICREKLLKANIPPTKVQVVEGDISDFEFDLTFDLITAPFRVIQNLETDEEIDGLFRCIRKHLAPKGTCILNVFRPFYSPEEMRKRWTMPEETLSWETPVEGGRIACYGRNAGIDPEKLVLYPELIYRRYEGKILVDESILKIVMRCYYPDAFEKLVTEHGFMIVNRWGAMKVKSTVKALN